MYDDFASSVCAFIHARRSRHDYAVRADAGDTADTLAIPTVGRPFVVAGHISTLVVGVVVMTEIALLDRYQVFESAIA